MAIRAIAPGVTNLTPQAVPCELDAILSDVIDEVPKRIDFSI
jgi:hypothetical protein